MPRTRREILFEVLVTVGIFAIPPALSAVRKALGFGLEETGGANKEWRFVASTVYELLCVGLFFQIIRLNGERLGNFTRPFIRSDVNWAVALAFWGTALNFLVTLTMRALANQPPKSFEDHLFKASFSPYYLAFVLVNPFCEELLVRGFLQRRLSQAGFAAAVVVCSSALVQTSYHLYQGFKSSISLGLLFLSFGIFYQVSGRLWPIIIAHLLLDLWAMFHFGL